jgi:tRNA(fMet)-specific endonuclease VapC
MTDRFMLDTDSISFAMRGEGHVNERMVQHLPTKLCLSAITLAELRYGASHRQSLRIQNAIDRITRVVKVEPFDERCAAQFGIIAADLNRRGESLSKFDALIAAHALTIDATLVTNNVKHFARIHGLRVENWL